MDAWEARNLALGRPADWQPEVTANAASSRRARAFGSGLGLLSNRSFGATEATEAAGLGGVAGALSAAAEPAAGTVAGDEKERQTFAETAFSDAVAIYLLSLALDFDYSELRERDYPLLAPGALAERLRLIAELYPPSAGYEFAVRYKRRA